MDISKTFIFDGKSCEDFGAIIGFFDGDEPDYSTGLNRETIKSDMNIKRKYPNYYGAKYNDCIKLNFGLVKNPCETNERSFSVEESRAINAWLTSSDIPKKLSFINSEIENYNYYAICTNIEDCCSGGVLCKKVTFECNSPFAFSDPIEIEYENMNGDSELLGFFCEADTNMFRPKLLVTVVDDTEPFSLLIINNTVQETNKKVENPLIADLTTSLSINSLTQNDYGNINRIIHFTNVDGDKSPISIDMQKKIMRNETGILSLEDIGYGNTTIDDSKYYFDLYMKQGINMISVSTKNCTVKLICEFPKKVGVLL